MAEEQRYPVEELQVSQRRLVVDLRNRIEELKIQVVEQQTKAEKLQAVRRKNMQARCFQMKRPKDRCRSGYQNMTSFKVKTASISCIFI